ncbi:MAG: TolC family protein [Acidobacteriia bacterium]|nr:TolC family protein [Terriglobia bacterium]
MKSNTRATMLLACLLCWLIFPPSSSAQDSGAGAEAQAMNDKPLPFRTAIELALKNSVATGVSMADLQRARATVSQTRDAYVPQMVFGSGLGWSYGFPLSLEGAAPSIFNVNIQGALWNPAQRDTIRAAKTDVELTSAQNAARRDDVIMETAVSYIQLDLLESSLSVQREQRQAAAKFQETVNQRVQEGLDSQVETTRAKLAVARTRLSIAQTQAAADQLRLRLSQLTGLPAKAIRTSTETIPALHDVSQDDDLPGQAAQKSLAVKVAEDAAQIKDFRARAERKLLYPSVDLVAQYAVLARFNNYDQFFQKFQRHNVTAGVAIRFPFFNATQHAAADAAKADAQKSHKEAAAVKEQVSGETLKLQRAVEQLAAARDVAQLEHQLAQSDIESAHARIESGQATVKDEQNARIAEHQRYAAYLESSFELDRAQVQLLRQTGELETWALGPGR